tara:strand:- start:120 stop:4319 length:4200 start_codon:yes stop_codon:yes gene_type:complete
MAFLNDVVSPPLYPEGVSDEAVDKAIKLSDNLLNHIKIHYGIFASQSLPLRVGDTIVRESEMSALDLLYYHVYGDYRLTMSPLADDDAPNYLKTRVPNTVLRYKTITPDGATTTNIKSDTDLNYLRGQLANEEFDMLHGVLGDTGTTPAETEWFIRDLAFGSNAPKFHLPSLGTMAITNYAYKNINEPLSKALAESLENLMQTIMFNKGRLPAALSDPFDAETHFSITDVDEELKGNPLIMQLAKAITLNQEYIDLQVQYPQVPSPSKVNGLAKGAYGKDGTFDAANHFFKQLLQMTNTKFTVGVPVEFKTAKQPSIAANSASYPDVLDGILGSAAEAVPIMASATYIVVDARAGPVYDIIMETDDGEEFQINSVPEKELQLSVGTIEDEALLEKARGKKGGKFTHPSLLVFQRIALDVFFSIEALVAACTVPHKFYLISPTINTIQKQKSVANLYPRMAKHITKDFDEFVMKNAKSTLEFLADIRMLHTVANIANSEKLILDSRTMEEFYRQDLRMAETTWLATALTDAGKVVFEKKEQPNLLAQLQYRPKGIDEDLFGEASVTPETVFYQIDSPILKDVIIKFDEEFVKFTVANAFAPKSKKKKKGGGGGSGDKKKEGQAAKVGQLANALWASIERRSSEIVNRPGIKPHILFDRLFARMYGISKGSPYIRDNFPPKWIGTNTVTLLTRAPETLGERLDMKFYIECMDEYIRHLKLLYKSQPPVAAAILSVITEVVVDAETDVDTLRKSFLARIKSQAAKPFLKGTSVVFDPFRIVMTIMRTEIDIPLKFREEYVARKLDQEQKSRVKDAFTSESEQVVLPKDHPEFKEKEVEVDNESALFGLPNPFSMPLPAYYPRPGERLNMVNPKVRRMISDMVGNPSDPNWPANGFQITVGIGGITSAQSMALKGRLLDPDTTFTVNPITWRGAELIWDGREKTSDKANPSAVAHFRDTLGVEFEVNTPSYPPMNLEIVPSNDLTNYSSMLYKKYLNDKYDEASYVYIPAGGVFKNPSVFRGSKRIETVKGEAVDLEELSPMERATLTEEDLKTEEEGGFAELFRDVEVTYEMDFENIDEPFDGLSSGGTMMFKGDVAELAKAVTKIPEDVESVDLPEVESITVDDGYDEEGRFVGLPPTDEEFEIITREDDDEPEVVVVEPAPVNVSLQGLEEPINRLSSSVDLAASEFGVAASRFETAADAFESASGNFVTSSRYFKEASDEFAKIPDAIKDGLQQLGERLIDKLGELDKNLVDGDIEDADDEDIKKGSEIIEKGLGGSEVKEIVRYTDFLANKFSTFFPARRYNYTKLGTMKDKIMVGDLDFTTLVTTEVSKGKALNWWRLSIAKAITQLPKLEKLDSMADTLNEKQLKNLRWNQYCITIVEAGLAGEDILPMLNLTPAD